MTGIAASDGIAFGEVYLLDRRTVKAPKYHIAEEEVDSEIQRFRDALKATHEQLQRLMNKLGDVGGGEHILILEAHQLILQDEHLVERAVQHITDELINAEWALGKTVKGIKAVFDRVEDDYFRERRSDVAFVADHLLRALTGSSRPLPGPPDNAVIVAHDLSPSETARFYRYKIKAFVTDVGGRTSHTAIVARSLAIPAVVGLKQVTAVAANGDPLIVDGYRGEVLIEPDEETVRRYQRRVRRRAQYARGLRRERELPAETLDGVRIQLLANIELSDEIPSALTHGAEGIGLYRTEFLYLGRPDLPTEEDHLKDARQVLSYCGGRQVTFRTCDLGADKVPGAQGAAAEANPALGLRSIRLCLDQRGLFKAQLLGLLQAAQEGDVRIMFPMISGLEELRTARAVLEECRAELGERGLEVPQVPVGVMVEMPSAAVTADLLAQEADFFSIGTNDLTQYALAIDRVNQQVNYLFRPCHPAILRLIRYVVEAADRHGLPVSVCGEMAGDPLMILVLVGLGVRVLSMNALSVPTIKRLVRGATTRAARKLARQVLALDTPQEVEQELLTAMESMFPNQSFASISEWDEDTIA